MPVSVHNDFLSKMEYLLAGRDRYPWGFSIGLTRGTINRIFTKGQLPSTETLIAISKAENVRIDWLLRGGASPFMLNRCDSDGAFAELLDEYLEEGWSVHLVSDNSRYAVILTQPGQYKLGERSIDYTITEVFVGPYGPAVNDRIRSLPPERVYTVTTDRSTMGRLWSAEMGTWLITSSPTALLSKAKSIESHPLPPPPTDQVAEATTRYNETEHEIMDEIHTMEEKEKQTALRVIKALKPPC